MDWSENQKAIGCDDSMAFFLLKNVKTPIHTLVKLYNFPLLRQGFFVSLQAKSEICFTFLNKRAMN